MTLTTDWLAALDGTNALDGAIKYSLHGFEHEVDSSDAAGISFEDADQVRAFVSYPQKRNFEGRFWLSSTEEHVPFESFWERAFLATLDRTGTARSVTAQPMWIDWRNPRRSHAPDYFVRRDDGSALLVDVREQSRIKPPDAAKFELTRRLAAALGWDYLVFDSLPGATQDNLRFLLRYRDPIWMDGIDLTTLPSSGSMSLAALVRTLGDATHSARGAAYALIWLNRARADLSRPLSMVSTVHFGSER
ncbi:hypothetical protein FM113_09025 [Leucobacter sp. 7(1)]|uniref:Transposase n=1 Tax=Microbacterium esteraromaticum TaxID=57043 RepID=A0A1R4JWF8_9MICO|nr:MULTISPECIES: TnsA-like heteromeric transposase endonuclease subunit [Microbacteriaceae]SJN10396.1 hypothetical protein FM113_09025 [Leucobacter sp. 7(1)]SJN36430.1 hypothetical protein FM104_09230 [Microbacterium esteraromaticum]